jgi:outer membrane lipoprotein-sorting protein
MKSVHYQKGDKWRSEANMNMDASGSNANGSLSAITLFDGADYWTVTMGMKMKLPPEQVGDQKTSDYWHAPPEGSTIIGDETVNGRDCWIVQYPENPMMKEAPRYWIDKEKFVFVRTVSELSGKEIRSDFSDFRTVKGDFEIPYHIDVYSGEDKTMTADVTKLEIGTGLSDELFDASKLAGGGMPGMGGGEIDIEQLMKQAEEMKKQYGGGEGE